jgi:hypothetical protein
VIIIELQEINKLLEDLPKQIESKTEQIIQAQEAYSKAKQAFEYKYSELYLSVKAVSPDATQGDLTANSKIGSNEARLDMIVKKSSMDRLKKEMQKLRDDFDATLEQSYNWRASVKRFRE